MAVEPGALQTARPALHRRRPIVVAVAASQALIVSHASDGDEWFLIVAAAQPQKATVQMSIRCWLQPDGHAFHIDRILSTAVTCE
jgi:hypothetical protein